MIGRKPQRGGLDGCLASPTSPLRFDGDGSQTRRSGSHSSPAETDQRNQVRSGSRYQLLAISASSYRATGRQSTPKRHSQDHGKRVTAPTLVLGGEYQEHHEEAERKGLAWIELADLAFLVEMPHSNPVHSPWGLDLSRSAAPMHPMFGPSWYAPGAAPPTSSAVFNPLKCVVTGSGPLVYSVEITVSKGTIEMSCPAVGAHVDLGDILRSMNGTRASPRSAPTVDPAELDGSR